MRTDTIYQPAQFLVHKKCIFADPGDGVGNLLLVEDLLLNFKPSATQRVL